jgi:hypothetical protein
VGEREGRRVATSATGHVDGKLVAEARGDFVVM